MDQIVDNSPLLGGVQLEVPEWNIQTQPQWTDSADHQPPTCDLQLEGESYPYYYLIKDLHSEQQVPAGPSAAVPSAIPTVSQPYSEPMVFQTANPPEAKAIIHSNIQIRPPTNTEGSQYKVVYNDNASNHRTQAFALVNINDQQQPPRMNTQIQTPPILSVPLLESRNPVRSNVVEHRELQCNTCGRFFSRQCGLTQHKKWAHTVGNTFTCSTCGKKFGSEEKLEKHLERHNATKKRFECEACKKQFWHKPDLKRHMLRHSNNNPFTCSKCGKPFTRQDHLVGHLRTHERREKKDKENASPLQGDVS